MSAVHDYARNRRWGHDYVFTPVSGGGVKARAMGWGRGIAAGDILLLENKANATGDSQYLVRNIFYHDNPRDMWSADLEFVPRLVQASATEAP